MINFGTACNLMTCSLQYHLQIDNKKNGHKFITENKLNIVLLFMRLKNHIFN